MVLTFKYLVKAAVVAASFVVAQLAVADEFQPIVVKINFSTGNDQQGYVYQVMTKIPQDRRLNELPYATLGTSCTKLSEGNNELTKGALVRHESYRCDTSLHGTAVGIRFAKPNPGLSSLISVNLGGGYTASTALAAHQPEWIIPPKLNSVGVSKDYFNLGVLHLLVGFDHQLFIACLLLICWPRARKLIWTITAFTLAHSISLALTAYGKITVNVQAVELVIALSIAYLASDIVRHLTSGDGTSQSLSYRFPASVAGGFGLLHGLGFANILNQFGLPKNDTLLALLSFNLGIEVGQLLFVFAVILLAWLVQLIFAPMNSSNMRKRLSISVSYMVGCTALYWTVERFINAI